MGFTEIVKGDITKILKVQVTTVAREWYAMADESAAHAFFAEAMANTWFAQLDTSSPDAYDRQIADTIGEQAAEEVQAAYGLLEQYGLINPQQSFSDHVAAEAETTNKGLAQQVFEMIEAEDTTALLTQQTSNMDEERDLPDHQAVTQTHPAYQDDFAQSADNVEVSAPDVDLPDEDNLSDHLATTQQHAAFNEDEIESDALQASDSDYSLEVPSESDVPTLINQNLFSSTPEETFAVSAEDEPDILEEVIFDEANHQQDAEQSYDEAQQNQDEVYQQKRL